MASHGTTTGKKEQPLLHTVTPAPQQHSAAVGGHRVQAAPDICLPSSAEEEAKSLQEFQPLTSSSCHCWCSCQERDPVEWCGANGSAAFDWFWSPAFFLFCPCSSLVVAWGKMDFYNHSFRCCGGFFFLLFSPHHMVGRRGFSTSLSLSPDISGEEFLCHLVFFVPKQSMEFSTFVSSDYYCYPACCCLIFSELMFFSLLCSCFHLSLLVKEKQLKLKEAVTHFGVSAPETIKPRRIQLWYFFTSIPCLHLPSYLKLN